MTQTKLLGYSYTMEEAKQARDSDRLLSIRLETSLACNIQCVYCCNNSGSKKENEISYQKLIDIIQQAKELGALSIVVIGGGEPTIYDRFHELIQYIDHMDLVPVIFTNTTTMTKELAAFLYEHKVSVITKLDSFDEETQDYLANKKGTYRRIQQGLANLMELGFNQVDDKGVTRLGASFVVNKRNMHEVGKIWSFCRDNNIFPNFELMVQNGQAEERNDLMMSPEEVKEIKDGLCDMDKNKYGISWEAHKPMCGGCRQVLYNAYITVDGKVRPCSSIHLEKAGIDLNINTQSLQSILSSPIFQLARNVEKHLTGKCGDCEKSENCIGCRAVAFNEGLRQGLDAFASLCYEDIICIY